MTARALLVASLLFFGLRLSRWAEIGTPIIPCDGSLVVYCWTADILGTGIAWLVWHAAFSLAIGFAIVALPKAYNQ